MSDEFDTRYAEIKAFLESSDDKIFNQKKDFRSVVADNAEALAILEQALTVWRSLLDEIRSLLSSIPLEQWSQICLQSEELLTLGGKILDYFSHTKETILPQALEHDQNLIVSGLTDLLRTVGDLLEICLPDRHIARPDLLYAVAKQKIQSNLKLSQCKNGLDTTKKSLRSTKKPRDWWPFRRWLSKLRFHVLVFLVFLVVLSRLPTDSTVTLKLLAKLFIVFVTLMWFPSVFVVPSGSSRNLSLTLFALAWSFVLLLWVYGVVLGTVSFALLVSPLAILLRSRREETDRNAQLIIRRVYWGMGLALFIMGSLITHENIWLIGAVIWWVFATVAQVSFRYFRYTFDMIASLDPTLDIAEVKRRLFYLAFIATILLLFFISLISGKLEREIAIGIYSQAVTLSFGIVVVLFAVQAIIPSITSWGGAEQQKRSPSHVREMKLLLRGQQGLTGFLQVFFAVFVFSLLGWVVSSIISPASTAIDLSLSFLTTPAPNLIDMLNPPANFQYSSEVTLTFVQTVLFSVLVCTFSYSLAVFYYLFIATNTLVLPIKDALLAQPALLRESRYSAGRGKQGMESKLEKSLHHSRKLRGEVITELRTQQNEAGEQSCTVTIAGDFDSTPEIIHKAMALLQAIFDVKEIQLARVEVIKSSFGTVESQKLFWVDVTRSEYENFLVCEIEGMDTEYKLIQLGARILRFLLPEAQIL